MFSKPISRRLALKLMFASAIGLTASVATSGDFRYEPRSEEYWPRNMVRSIQRRLKEIGFSPGPVDGIYGPKTKNAIMGFQRANHLEVDGKISNELVRDLKIGQ
jgi:hypothetical protein